ncbi:hypothetical protein ACKC9G_09210 [Pokkaliibacter sp. CJK22405]|uniref:hypothetical protein n=1 Tax=Pokkaliibacter sp. CJK22405 TaxID=3384615 RepID=UPI0039853586
MDILNPPALPELSALRVSLAHYIELTDSYRRLCALVDEQLDTPGMPMLNKAFLRKRTTFKKAVEKILPETNEIVEINNRRQQIQQARAELEAMPEPPFSFQEQSLADASVEAHKAVEADQSLYQQIHRETTHKLEEFANNPYYRFLLSRHFNTPEYKANWLEKIYHHRIATLANFWQNQVKEEQLRQIQAHNNQRHQALREAYEQQLHAYETHYRQRRDEAGLTDAEALLEELNAHAASDNIQRRNLTRRTARRYKAVAERYHELQHHILGLLRNQTMKPLWADSETRTAEIAAAVHHLYALLDVLQPKPEAPAEDISEQQSLAPAAEGTAALAS